MEVEERVKSSLPVVTFVVLIHCVTAIAGFQPGQGSPPHSPSMKTSRPPLMVTIQSNIGRPGALLYSLESDYIVQMNYTLKCASYDTVYSVVASTSAENIARITSDYTFNVSCANAKPMNGTALKDSVPLSSKDGASIGPPKAPPENFIGVSDGQVNMTVRTNMIGRSFFILIAQKLSGPDSPELRENSTHHDVSLGHKPPRSPSYGITSRSGGQGSLCQNCTADPQPMGDGPGQVVPGMPPNAVGRAMIIVMQLPRTVDKIFRIVLYAVIVSATAGMGVKVDLVVVRQVLKKPVAPLIGLGCQYICMPLVAYTVASLVPQESAAISLGIFTCGIVPGGGASNMFSYLLGGDLSLSVTLTTLSNIASLGLLPLYIFTLGATFKDDTVKLKVPYEKILETLAIVLLPLFVGIFIQYKFPRVAKIFSKVLKPVLIVIVAFLISFGIYTNFFIFKMIRPMSILAGCLLPYFGYLIGGLVSLACCQTWTRVKTMAIETGIQNTGISFLILFLSLPPPDNQLSAVAPASSAIMTPLPLFVAVIVYTIYNRCIRKDQSGGGNLTKEEEARLENGTEPEETEKEILSKLAHGEGTAAIIILWRKITGTKEEINPAEKFLNQEFEVAPPEEENLMDKDRETII